MKEALIFHFPFERGEQTPPEATVMVRRVAANHYLAGMAVCSQGDQFRKELGRVKAHGRLYGGNPFSAETAGELINLVQDHLNQLALRRPTVISAATLQGLEAIIPKLDKMVVT